MNYFSIGFRYTGKENFVAESISDIKTLVEVQQTISSVLISLDIDNVAENIGLDGSVYQTGQTFFTAEEVEAKVKSILEGQPIEFVEIATLDPLNDSGYSNGQKVPVAKLFALPDDGQDGG